MEIILIIVWAVAIVYSLLKMCSDSNLEKWTIITFLCILLPLLGWLGIFIMLLVED